MCTTKARSLIVLPLRECLEIRETTNVIQRKREKHLSTFQARVSGGNCGKMTKTASLS